MKDEATCSAAPGLAAAQARHPPHRPNRRSRCAAVNADAGGVGRPASMRNALDLGLLFHVD
eukprot:scaffold237531_cov34-Tisochrysis_lutea.AAC.1